MWAVLEYEDLSLVVRDDGIVLRRGDRVLLESQLEDPRHGGNDELRRGDAYAPFASASTIHRTVGELFGFFRFDEQTLPPCEGESDLNYLDGSFARIGPNHLDGRIIEVVGESGSAEVQIVSDELAASMLDVR